MLQSIKCHPRTVSVYPERCNLASTTDSKPSSCVVVGNCVVWASELFIIKRRDLAPLKGLNVVTSGAARLRNCTPPEDETSWETQSSVEYPTVPLRNRTTAVGGFGRMVVSILRHVSWHMAIVLPNFSQASIVGGGALSLGAAGGGPRGGGAAGRK